jgi:hypothetical protein
MVMLTRKIDMAGILCPTIARPYVGGWNRFAALILRFEDEVQLRRRNVEPGRIIAEFVFRVR